MARTHFINPYTFIPLSKEGPLIKANNPTHALFQKDCFTGIIECQLSFFTAAVIPGFQKSGTQDQPGEIKTFTYGEHLAIPGSRIRGHLFHLMRAINSSPITVVQDMVILERRRGSPQKGILLKDNSGNWLIREVLNEVLVAHPNRNGNPKLQNDCKIKHEPKAENEVDIPCFDSAQTIAEQGLITKICCQHPDWPPDSLQAKKFYLAQENVGTPLIECGNGRWVKISAWSGQDGENQLRDIRGNRSVHRNAWHLINLNDIGQEYLLSNDMIKTYKKCINEMANLISERDKDDLIIANRTLDAENLKSGTFLYFIADTNCNITSFGQHYHYLKFIGSVLQKTQKANSILNNGNQALCAVRSFSGWANDNDTSGMKGRMWVEMAKGPNRNAMQQLENKKLRILSSQPPKASCFYLENGDYQNSDSVIRGRKFYWHDPNWDKPMWDNIDSKVGKSAFENPFPNKNKKQWANAETIMATKDKPISFNFKIRLMNATADELNLLLTALVGFVTGAGLKPFQEYSWCHKIGHARPYIGSCEIQIANFQKLNFNENTFLPELNYLDKIEVQNLQSSLHEWQKTTLNGQHIEMVKRIMNFTGAYLAGEDDCGTRITYPVTAVNNSEIQWTSDEHPKTFAWFRQNKDKGHHSLPIPNPGLSQALPVNPVSSDSNTNRRTNKKPGNSGSNLGAFAGAFANAKITKQSNKGRK